MSLTGGKTVLRIHRALALGAIGLLVPSVALAAPAPKMQHAMLHVPAKLKGDMRFKHVMASATLSASNMDVAINFTASNLPAASALHAKYYVLWATNGTKKADVGALTMHGAMASVKGSVMWHSVQDLVVTAEATAKPMHPMGQTVLSGMVG